MRNLSLSEVVQALIAISCIFAVLWLAISNQPIPDVLANITALIVGYYFARQQQAQVLQAVASALSASAVRGDR